MSTQTTFIEPLDVLFLRGNKLFGDPGSHGESLIPPWPSVAAGALRSRILTDHGVDLKAFAQGKLPHPELGTPREPGSFTLTAFHLARRFADGRVETLMAPPADLIISETDGTPAVRKLAPTALAAGLQASQPLDLLPVLAENTRSKPAGGYWLSESGWTKYLAGQTPGADDLVRSSQLWRLDHRVGVGLDAATRRAEDGKLFSMQAVAMGKTEHGGGFDVGFVAAASGATLPQGGMLRLGGDGRGAAIRACAAELPEADYAHITHNRKCRLVLTTPGIFPDGWRLPGIGADSRFSLHGVSARLVCAAVPRCETVSGWDLARHQPKTAQRVAPAGSVYWLDELDGTPEALHKLVATGLWSEPCEDAHRRAEGFNRFALAQW